MKTNNVQKLTHNFGLFLLILLALNYLTACGASMSFYPVTEAKQGVSYDPKKIRCLWGCNDQSAQGQEAQGS